MLLTDSENAKVVRQIILDITIDTLNKKAGGTTKYINQRDEDFLDSWFNSDLCRKEFTNALKNYVEGGKSKYGIYTNKIYTSIFKEKFTDQFVLISSGSSQFFCGILYPLVSNFETQLRYALYISRALYNSENIDTSCFLLKIGKSEYKIEELDFGQIYEAVFTDKSIQEEIKNLTSKKWSKTDLINYIQSWKENTMWQNMVGENYDYIENNFLKLKEFRNHVMHSHLIDFDTYDNAKRTLESATKELKKAIGDKLIVNESEYLNKINIIDTISGIVKTMEKVNEFLSSNQFVNALEKLSQPINIPNFAQYFVDAKGDKKDYEEEIKNE